MGYSKSVFFVPILIEDFKKLKATVAEKPYWEKIRHDELKTNYLLYYAARISQDDTLFTSYRYTWRLPDIYMFKGYEELEISQGAEVKLSEIRFSAFSTDVGFLEFRVTYENATPEDVRNFAYLFKKATKGAVQAKNEGKPTLYDTVCRFCEEIGFTKPFFTATVNFKYEALCYHYMNLEQGDHKSEVLMKRTKMLARSYSDLFENINDISDYDMYFTPYNYEHWGGSTEGLANLSFMTGSVGTDYYLENYKINQLEKDYYFLYLLLLNQRFAAIRYINEVAMAEDSSPREKELLSHKIIRLKTIFSFKVISDDRIYQNIYARMYNILDIDCLIEDIKDNENQMELIWNTDLVKRDKRTSIILFALSALSLFSALIDASTFVDRFGVGLNIATTLGIVLPVLTALGCILYWWGKK